MMMVLVLLLLMLFVAYLINNLVHLKWDHYSKCTRKTLLWQAITNNLSTWCYTHYVYSVRFFLSFLFSFLFHTFWLKLKYKIGANLPLIHKLSALKKFRLCVRNGVLLDAMKMCSLWTFAKRRHKKSVVDMKRF